MATGSIFASNRCNTKPGEFSNEFRHSCENIPDNSDLEKSLDVAGAWKAKSDAPAKTPSGPEMVVDA
jgi:hypothetical protein